MPTVILEPADDDSQIGDDLSPDEGSFSFDIESESSSAVAGPPPRKLSNVSQSLKRRLSGCFRKQDSNDRQQQERMLKDDDQDEYGGKSSERPSSWYRKASKIIRHRSVSEERTQKPSSSSNQAVIVPTKSTSTHSIADHVAPVDTLRRFSASSGRFLTAATTFPSSSSAPPQHHSDSNLIVLGNHDNRLQPPSMPQRAGSYHGMKPSTGVGSAESLVGRVLVEQGLGKYLDPSVVRVAQRELAEACNMTPEGEHKRPVQKSILIISLVFRNGTGCTPTLASGNRFCSQQARS